MTRKPTGNIPVLPTIHLVMGMRLPRCLLYCTFWVNSFRGDLTENLSVCAVTMTIGIGSVIRQPLSRHWPVNTHPRGHTSHLWWATCPGHLRLHRSLLCRVWGRQSPRILAGARRVRFPGDGDVDCATWSPPDLVSLHDRPTAPYDGFGERTKSCALSVVSVVVLGGDAIGRGVSSRLDLHGGSRCHGVT
jgi:hypothetical protein